MARRAHSAETEFGSDSFLDVMSNIVGILIILIVMAGMQLSRTPLPATTATLTSNDESSAPPSNPVAASAAIDAEQDEVTDEGMGLADGQSSGLEPLPLPDLTIPPEEIRRALADLASEQQSLANAAAEEERLIARLREQYELSEQELAAMSQGADSQKKQLEANKKRLSSLKSQIGEARQRLSGILADFEETKKSQPVGKTIKHRLTPVSQEVTGDEVHFRLAGKRVCVVPLNELLERVKRQVERRRELATSKGGYKGTVGPLDGFSLEFVIETRRMSPQEERAHGMREGYSLELSRCVIIPDPTFQGETVQEALQRGSRFAMALRTASAGSTLTFWTYPDSFGTFRELQSASHDEGFLVAGRPMPWGQNIIGDRRLGTRSSGQ